MYEGNVVSVHPDGPRSTRQATFAHSPASIAGLRTEILLEDRLECFEFLRLFLRRVHPGVATTVCVVESNAYCSIRTVYITRSYLPDSTLARKAATRVKHRPKSVDSSLGLDLRGICSSRVLNAT